MRTIKQCLSSRLHLVEASRRPHGRPCTAGLGPSLPSARRAIRSPLSLARGDLLAGRMRCDAGLPGEPCQRPEKHLTFARAWILTLPRKASPVGHAWFSRTASKAQKGGAAYAPPRRKRNSGARYLIATSLPSIPSVNSQRVIVSPESNMATSLSPSPQFTESLPWPSATSIVSLPAAPCTSSRPP